MGVTGEKMEFRLRQFCVLWCGFPRVSSAWSDADIVPGWWADSPLWGLPWTHVPWSVHCGPGALPQAQKFGLFYLLIIIIVEVEVATCRGSDNQLSAWLTRTQSIGSQSARSLLWDCGLVKGIARWLQCSLVSEPELSRSPSAGMGRRSGWPNNCCPLLTP